MNKQQQMYEAEQRVQMASGNHLDDVVQGCYKNYWWYTYDLENMLQQE